MMNQQIRRLLDQARVETGAELGYYSAPAEERFAQLLIQDNIQTLINNGYTDAAQCLQDVHFGLKEAP